MIEVGRSPIHGRGAFAARPIAGGEAFHLAHLLEIPCAEAAAFAATRASHYAFWIADCPETGLERLGLALSPISFVNHRRPPNAAFAVDAGTLTIAFTALADIAAGEEILIDYGDFAERLGIA
jgi:hypothetical protein